jgi:PhnB protein
MHGKNITTVNPYLTFPGNCREAMSFYKDALNGELEIMPFRGSPVKIPEEYKNSVLHATLRFGDGTVMASDGMPDQELTNGNSDFISIACNNEIKAQLFFSNLSSGGTVIMPFEETFWDAKFGICIDKFGKSWMVNCQLGND